MESISFTCMHCERRLKAPAGCAGKVVKCPRCLERTEVRRPDDAVSYALAGDVAPSEGANAKGRSPAELWYAYGYAELSAKSKSRLGEAREFAADGEWERAALLLNKLFRASAGGGMTRENAVFRVPLSHCLTRQATAELEELRDDREADLSRPMRRLLEDAAHKQKWGGVFGIRECGLCGGPLRSIAGRPSVRTTVGTAY